LHQQKEHLWISAQFTRTGAFSSAIRPHIILHHSFGSQQYSSPMISRQRALFSLARYASIVHCRGASIARDRTLFWRQESGWGSTGMANVFYSTHILLIALNTFIWPAGRYTVHVSSSVLRRFAGTAAGSASNLLNKNGRVGEVNHEIEKGLIASGKLSDRTLTAGLKQGNDNHDECVCR
jgi:hypothetical protein